MSLPPSYTASNIPPSCCTCAAELLPQSEKKTMTHLDNRQLPCCHRFICGKCIDDNPRFAAYCPFCQTRSNSNTFTFGTLPPSYSTTNLCLPNQPIEQLRLSPHASFPSKTDSLIHFIHPHETLSGIALAYRIPVQLLRQHNMLFSDHLLPARRYLLVPRAHYSGPSLSPSPIKPPELETKEMKLKRFQIQTKCVEYGIAKWYLRGSGWDYGLALKRWQEDEAWEKRNCLQKEGTLLPDRLTLPTRRRWS